VSNFFGVDPERRGERSLSCGARGEVIVEAFIAVTAFQPQRG
jgi:hypothetical protein